MTEKEVATMKELNAKYKREQRQAQARAKREAAFWEEVDRRLDEIMERYNLDAPSPSQNYGQENISMYDTEQVYISDDGGGWG